MSQLVKLPSGLVFDTDRLVMALTSDKAIGQFGLILIGSPPDMIPVIDGNDMDALIENGFISELKRIDVETDF